MDLRDAFFLPLLAAAQKDPNIIFLSDDFDIHVLKEFARDFPERYINVGAAEQNIINLAAGLAMAGKKVYVIGIASFITSRCFEQIKVNLVSMKLPVTIVGVGPGFSFSADGPTHHGLHDYALMNMLNPMRIYNPCDPISAKTAAYFCQLNTNGPMYVRLDKGEYPDIFQDDTVSSKFIHRSLAKKLVITAGTISHRVINLFKTNALEKEYNLYVTSSFSESIWNHMFNNYVDFKEYKTIYVVEENIPTLVHEIRQYATCPVVSIAARPGEQLLYGSREYMLKENGLDEMGILKQLL